MKINTSSTAMYWALPATHQLLAHLLREVVNCLKASPERLFNRAQCSR
jgi:hypothetical protein